MNRIIDFFENHQNTSGPKIFLPDLTIWYEWHSHQGTLPEDLAGKDLVDVCRALEVPLWKSIRPWETKSSAVEVTKEDTDEKRTVTYRYNERSLTASWIKGPDGDWWQSEYPVKTVEDLDIISAYLEGRSFAADTGALLDTAKRTGEAGVVVPVLPPRAFAWLMLDIVGWSEGIMVLIEAADRIAELVAVAEQQVRNFSSSLVKELTNHGFSVYLSPDNLDGMFISPQYFNDYLAEGYTAAAGVIHEHNASLLVHGGGPLGGILKQIAEAGIDCLAGVSGPPQGDTPLAAAREKAGDDLILWGGIPQDFLMDSSSFEEFTAKVDPIIGEYSKDENSIIGIADHVPLEADISRLRYIARAVNEYH